MVKLTFNISLDNSENNRIFYLSTYVTRGYLKNSYPNQQLYTFFEIVPYVFLSEAVLILNFGITQYDFGNPAFMICSDQN